MSYGVDQFMAERARSGERVSRLTVVVGLVLLGLVCLPQLLLFTPLAPKVRHVMRFGFEGPERFVRTVQLVTAPGPYGDLQDVGRVIARPSQAGGGGSSDPEPSSRSTRASSRGENTLPGAGDAHLSLVQRALSSEGRTPVFQSEELVIEHLVKPVYPEEARDRGVEGKVAVIALIDTMGHVAEAEIMTGSGSYVLDRAATDAVVLCRFRPYLKDGIVQEVYAVFHFAFRIY